MLPKPDGMTWDVMNTGMKAVANVDWNDLILKNWAPRQKHNLSISGGTENINYYVSAGYYDEKGLLKIGNEWYKKYTIDTKIEAKATSWMKISFLAKYRHGHENFPWNQHWGRAWIMNWISKIKPGLPAKYDGSDIWTLESRIGEWELLREDYIRKQLVASPRITLEPVAGWVTNIELNYVVNNDQYETMVKQVPWLRPNGEIAYRPTTRAETEYNSSLFSNEYLSPNIYSSYTRSFGRHNLNVMAGYQQEVYKYNDLMAESFHVVTDAVPSIATAVGEKKINDNVGHWATRSVFGRLNYNFSERYLLEINIRRDGSSRFEEDERWGTFPSLSAGWIISNENFFPLTDQIDFLKIRGSYGTLGNQNVANYLYVPRLPTKQTDYWLFSGERPWTVGAPDLTSVNLTWEKVKTIDFGIDFRTLNNRLAATFDWYQSLTTDLVGPGEALPSVLGTAVPKKNEGEIQTRGWELEISWKSRVNDFSYGFRGVLSDYIAKVTNYRNPTKILSTYYEGMVLGEIWGFESGGLYQSDADIEAWGIDQSYIYNGTWYPGDQKYIDKNGDDKIDIGSNTVDDPGDKVILGNNTPRFQYGLSANASWKGFDISILFQGIAKRDLDMRTLGVFRGPANGPMHAGCLVDHLDYWRDDTSPLGANPDAYFPRPYSQYIGQNGKNYNYPVDRWMQNGAYLRLKNVILGYTLPASLTQKVFISNARIYLSGENLLTFTDLMFFDPESFAGRWYGAGDAYPLSKMYSIGLTVTF
jgi:TonB-linked SusC/RagA family outer membrane protein